MNRKTAFVILTEQGVRRIMNGKAGMVFAVDSHTQGVNGPYWVAHVRDYRDSDKAISHVSRKGPHCVPFSYCMWSLGEGDYEPLGPTLPYFDAVKDKRLSEMNAEQVLDAKELWIREQAAWLQGSDHIHFLVRRLDEARGAE